MVAECGPGRPALPSPATSTALLLNTQAKGRTSRSPPARVPSLLDVLLQPLLSLPPLQDAPLGQSRSLGTGHSLSVGLKASSSSECALE